MKAKIAFLPPLAITILLATCITTYLMSTLEHHEVRGVVAKVITLTLHGSRSGFQPSRKPGTLLQRAVFSRLD